MLPPGIWRAALALARGPVAKAAALGLAACLHATPAAAACEPWPGEPSPLPTLEDPDALRAEWASLRARELATLAQRFEGRDDLRAQQFWRHLLCLDPTHGEALASVLRTSAVRVHRPPLRDVPFEESSTGDPWRTLGAPLGVQTAQRVRVATGQGELFAAVRDLDEKVRRARFDEALRSAALLRSAVSKLPSSESRVQLLVETEVLAATAELALGRQQQAEASLGRALDAYPGLELDASTTSPKVLRALDAARQARSEGRL